MFIFHWRIINSKTVKRVFYNFCFALYVLLMIFIIFHVYVRNLVVCLKFVDTFYEFVKCKNAFLYAHTLSIVIHSASACWQQTGQVVHNKIKNTEKKKRKKTDRFYIDHVYTIIIFPFLRTPKIALLLLSIVYIYNIATSKPASRIII